MLYCSNTIRNNKEVEIKLQRKIEMIADREIIIQKKGRRIKKLEENLIKKIKK